MLGPDPYAWTFSSPVGGAMVSPLVGRLALGEHQRTLKYLESRFRNQQAPSSREGRGCLKGAEEGRLARPARRKKGGAPKLFLLVWGGRRGGGGGGGGGVVGGGWERCFSPGVPSGGGGCGGGAPPPRGPRVCCG